MAPAESQAELTDSKKWYKICNYCNKKVEILIVINVVHFISLHVCGNQLHADKPFRCMKQYEYNESKYYETCDPKRILIRKSCEN